MFIPPDSLFSLFSNTCIYSANRASRGYFVFLLYSARKNMLWLLGTCFLCSQMKKLLRVHLWILSDRTCKECAEAYKVQHAPGNRCTSVPYIKVWDKHMPQSWSRWIHILSGCSAGGMGSYLQRRSGLTFSYIQLVCVISWQMRLREACDSEENTYANLISRKTRCEMFAKDNRVICITSWGFIQRANC